MWKDTNVVPLYKRGDKSDAKNYWPVSLTSMVSKVTERIVRQHLYDHLSTNGLVSDAQHGFRPGRSCESQLLALSMCGTSQWRTGSLLMCCSWTCLRPSIESLTCAKLRMMVTYCLGFGTIFQAEDKGAFLRDVHLDGSLYRSCNLLLILPFILR